MFEAQMRVEKYWKRRMICLGIFCLCDWWVRFGIQGFGIRFCAKETVNSAPEAEIWYKVRFAVAWMRRNDAVLWERIDDT